MQLCVRLSCFVPTKTTLLVVEENEVLVEHEVVANLLFEGGHCEGTARREDPC